MDSQTTKDPLAELVDDIERRIAEARRAHQDGCNKGSVSAIYEAEAVCAALVGLRDAHDRRMREAADVENRERRFPAARGSAKRKRVVECSTCMGSSFEPHGDDFICLNCGAIIDGPWPAWATEPRPSPSSVLNKPGLDK